jgi:hypothetical protein
VNGDQIGFSLRGCDIAGSSDSRRAKSRRTHKTDTTTRKPPCQHHERDTLFTTYAPLLTGKVEFMKHNP